MFENSLAYKEMIGEDLIIIDGMYDDGWVEKDCSFKILLEDDEDIKIDYYSLKSQNVQVFVNGEKVDTVNIKPNDDSFVIDCNENGWNTIELVSDYEEALKNPDKRVCSFVLNEIEKGSY